MLNNAPPCFLSGLSRMNAFSQTSSPLQGVQTQKDSYRVWGWCLTLVFTACVLLLVHFSALNDTASRFTVIFSAALGMWVFRLVPESVPAIFVLCATMALNTGPSTAMLSGFVSDSFFLASSLFAIGCVLVKSRLLHRVSLLLLCRLRPGAGGLQLLLFGTGLLMTPLVSVQSSRVALMAPLLDSLLESGRIAPRSPAANALACSAFQGCILFSTVFLTGKSSNTILYAMMTLHTHVEFGIVHWLSAALVPGLLLALLFLGLQRRRFGRLPSLCLSRFRLTRELRAMGNVSRDEWVVLGALIVLLAGLGAVACWRLSGMWVCMAVFAVLLGSGAMGRQELTGRINWTFLFYLGAIIGIMRYIQDIGMEDWLFLHLKGLVPLAKARPGMFIATVFGISWLSTLVLGTLTAPAILFTVFLPIANQSGLGLWVVAFVILTATEAWIFPWQSTYFLCFENLLSRNQRVEMRPLLGMNLWMVPGKLGILLASLPYWRWLGEL